MYSRVIVPLDGSETAAQVLPFAALIAKALDAPVELLEAVTPLAQSLPAAGLRYPGAPLPSADRLAQLQQESREAAQSRLEASAGPLRQQGLSVDITVAEASPEDAIVNAALDRPGSLIAISTHGRSGLGRWMLGSVTDKVIRTATSPVLVIRARETPMADARITRVVLPLDGSPASELAVPHAVAIAKGLGIGVTVLRSISPLVYGDTFADYVPTLYSDLVSELDTEVKAFLEEKAAQVRKDGVADVDLSAPDGYPATAIMDEVGPAGEKLVVMATHGRAGVERWLLGSVADRVVRHGTGPVLVVRPS